MKTSTVSSILVMALLATAEVGMAQQAPMSRATLDGVALDYEMWGGRRARRARACGHLRRLVQAAAGRARAHRPAPRAELPPRRLCGQQPRARAGEHRPAGRPPADAHAPARHPAGARRRALLRGQHRAPARPGRPGDGAVHRADGAGACRCRASAPSACSPRGRPWRRSSRPTARATAPGPSTASCASSPGPDYRGVLDQVLPGAFEQAVTDADTFFGQELPAVQQWTLTREDRGPDHPARPLRDRREEQGGVAHLDRASRDDPGLAAQGGGLRACPTRPICCTSSSPARWPRRWPPSSPVTRSGRRDGSAKMGRWRPQYRDALPMRPRTPRP